jgi:hypothetical protein
MSDTIVEIVSVEASTLTVDVIMPPSVAMVIEVVDFAGPPIGYPQLPEELRQLPISFPFTDKPGTGTTVNVPMGFAVTVPVGLAGARTYAGVKPAVGSTFTLNRVAGGVVTELGTVTLTPATNTSRDLAGPGGPLAAGDVMQIVAGASDANAADIGITIMANRV